MEEHYKNLEMLLKILLPLLKYNLDTQDLHDVQEYVDAGEYGVALDLAVAIVIQNDESLSQQAYGLIEELNSLMPLEDSKLMLKLAAKLADG